MYEDHQGEQPLFVPLRREQFANVRQRQCAKFTSDPTDIRHSQAEKPIALAIFARSRLEETQQQLPSRGIGQFTNALSRSYEPRYVEYPHGLSSSGT